MKREKQIATTLTAAEKEALQQQAAQEGQSVSAFIRRLILTYLRASGKIAKFGVPK